MEIQMLTIACIEDFRQWLSTRGSSPNTIKGYSTDIKMFLLSLPDMSLEACKLETAAAAWLNWGKDTKNPNRVSASTTRRRAASVKEFADWMGTKVLEEYKLPVAKEATPHPLPNLKRDLDAMMSCCRDDNQRALVALLGLEGMRLHEALELPLSAINVREMTITVWGKGDKERVIPITTLAWEYVGPRLVMQQLGGRANLIEYSDRGARAFITELGVKACISRPVASHDLRATFATLAYRASGNDIRLVQAWLGHADVTTTQGYVGVKMEDMKSAGEF